MPALLDFLTTPDAQLGLNLLAAGGPTTDPNRTSFGARVSGAVQATRAMQDLEDDRKLKQAYTQGQIDAQKLAGQKYNDQKAALGQYFALLGGNPAAGAASVPGTPALLADASGGASAPAGGAPAAPVAGGAGMPSGGFDLSKLTPNEIARLQVAAKTAGMPDPVEVWKASRPQYVENKATGLMFNQNDPRDQNTPSGSVVTVRTPDGKVIQQDMRTGQVSLAPGSLDTFTQFQRASAEEGARVKPGRPALDPVTGEARGQSELAEVGGDSGATSGPVIGTLGMRNNNPGNLRPVGASTGFQQFDTPEAGLAALDQNLQAYGKRGINTIAGVVGRWAPGNENNTAAYTAAVSRRLGIPADQQIDLGNPYVRQALGTAIMLQENGSKILTGPSIGRAPAADGGDTTAASRGPVVALGAPAIAANRSREAFATKTADADADQLKAWRDGATAGQQAIQTAQNLRRIASQGIYEGGGAQAKTAIAGIINGLTGYTPKGLPGSEEFNAEASNLVLGQIKALGANPSNADRDFIMRTIPQIDRSPDARNALINFMEQKGRSAIDLYNRADTYARKNSGLGGFDQFAAPAAAPSQPTSAPVAIPQGWSVTVKGK